MGAINRVTPRELTSVMTGTAPTKGSAAATAASDRVAAAPAQPGDPMTSAYLRPRAMHEWRAAVRAAYVYAGVTRRRWRVRWDPPTFYWVAEPVNQQPEFDPPFPEVIP